MAKTTVLLLAAQALGLIVASRASGQDASVVSAAQRRDDSLRVVLNHSFVSAQLEPSFITVGGPALNIRQLGNAPRSLFEGMIVPHMSLIRPDNGRFAIFITPKVIARQLTEKSVPVRSPSFMPRATVYLALKAPVRGTITSSAATITPQAAFLSVTISHHSNGQEDSTFRMDSLGMPYLNLRNGEFSTNFAEANLNFVYLTKARESSRISHDFVSFGVRAYDRASTTPELLDRYGMWRLITRYSKLANIGSGLRGDLKVEANGQVLFGGRLSPSDFPVIGSLDIGWRPEFFDDFWLFAGYYWGQDYYNLSGIGPRLKNLRIGIMNTAVTSLRAP